MTAELCPTCGIWWRGVEHSCAWPIYSTSTAGLPLADTDPRDAEIARLRAIEEAAQPAWVALESCRNAGLLSDHEIGSLNALAAALSQPKETDRE